jgi:GDPmannose 4,6-dehydratase
MTKTAFITGISGQDGSLLAKFLLDKGYKVCGLMKEKSSKDNLEDILYNPNLHIVYGDLLNSDLLRLILETNKFDEIYNLASQSNIRLSYDDPLLTFNVTLIGTVSLLENIRKYSPKSKIFQAGSSSMFGNSIDEDGFQRETTSFVPISPYASSKLFTYNICNNYKENNNLFISNGILYNHESTKNKTLLGLINTVAKNAVLIANGEINEYYIPNLKINVDWGHADDYIEAMWLTLQQPKANNYVIASGKIHNIEYVCEYIFSSLGLDYKSYIKTESGTIESLKLKGDPSILKSIGWEPKYTFNAMLDEIINYWIKKYELQRTTPLGHI